eukprot:CAMPEP_0197436160 /NCGR_PEP_ID=MMETSP1175-20131217/3630_1 /TAXON_ID=1003142 /ORGANISM="Triceratium dubium, Strain CCMP147" /LENGTH=235 /DNA_ID=CAMNT_0042965379 /DNA_START=260 /DNA_END=967 /DNA_ORIENTATION=+
MALDISDQTSVGVAIAAHPSQSATVHTLDPIKLVKGKPGKKTKDAIDEAVIEQLEDLVRKHKVCGFVVGWPLQPEGRPGKPCGRVLHVLDTLTEKRTSVLSKSRPFTLWDDRCIPRETGEAPRSSIDDEIDSWGRSVAFSQAPPPSTEPGDELMFRSRDRYERPTIVDSSGAGGILRHFVGSFWEPTNPSSKWEEDRRSVKRTPNRAQSVVQEKKLFDSFDQYNDDKVCIKEALL